MNNMMQIFGRLPLILSHAGWWPQPWSEQTVTLIFYGIFFTDRLLLDLVLTTIITLLVGFPIAYFFLGSN